MIEESQNCFEKFLQGHDLRPDLRGAVYAVIARYGRSTELEKLIQLYRNSPLQEEKVRVLRALTRFQDPVAIKRVLKFALSSDVRYQDTYIILGGFGSNAAARRSAWDFNQSNFKILRGRYEGGSVSMLGHILEGSVCSFNHAADLKEVKNFLKKNPVPGIERTMKQSIEMIRSNIRWGRFGSKDAALWLARHKSS